ncbi:MAG: hypothetical protein ABSH56_17545 [Bryobacteraceae bacterium]|jgi:hypothetical protein
MRDYTWPSVFFAYFFFALSLALGLYFLFRSRHDGYWGKDGEKVKYQVFQDEPGDLVGQVGNLSADCQSAPSSVRSDNHGTD